MTTTYELYTNENGTPKAVEGKAPAILERVETLETNVKTLDGDIKTLDEDVGNIQTAIEVLEGGVVKTINGETPDQAGNIDIPVGHNVGEEWISYTGKIPNGGVPYCGQTVTRATYADLWAYAQAQGLVKTESEWQSWSSSHGGNVPYYSSGNGSTTFRMPAIKGYVKGASSQSEAGTYVKEGLPNITGKTGWWAGSYDQSGVFAKDYSTGNRSGTNLGGDQPMGVTFDASRSSSIYGNSNHVTPETSVVMFGVYAFGEIVNLGSLDATTLASALAKVEANIASLPSPNDYIVETYRNGTEWYEVYKSGKVRQGGYITKKGVGSSHTFLKPFADTNFALLVTPLTTHQGIEWPHYIFANTKTRTGFTFDSANHKELHYIAEGQGA